MKYKLMTPEAIKEIESLIPDHGEALMQYGAQMYRDGIVEGAIYACIGMAVGMIASVVKEIYIDTEKKKNSYKTES